MAGITRACVQYLRAIADELEARQDSPEQPYVTVLVFNGFGEARFSVPADAAPAFEARLRAGLGRDALVRAYSINGCSPPSASTSS